MFGYPPLHQCTNPLTVAGKLVGATMKRSALVHQETNNDTSDIVSTTSLICFLHQSLCCLLCIFNRFNRTNSFLI
uniref:Uncharacterized protein n=1 Tax=Medicago truncatula TaxID=3880 RepID=I3SV76_MEDTR|nr:unknown [Medicago truncatula]